MICEPKRLLAVAPGLLFYARKVIRKMKRKIEILAPAGSFEGMKAAIQGGADAVYIGGQKFGARAFANNLNEEEMIKAIEYVHVHGKRIYLTINTLVKQKEIGELYDYLLPFYLHGLDAVIVQDFGVLSYVHRTFPEMEIHASTQMTLTMAEGANLLKKYGVTRLVTSRELSVKEIKDIRKHTDLEIESFVHGALCYSFSGQCLMSSMIGGRSGNRGRCAQPCRKDYTLKTVDGESVKMNHQFLLSPKDMCTIYDVPELVESGIDSFKIEGRMKRPEYAALTAGLYRKYTDIYQDLGKKEYEYYIKKHSDELDKDMQKLMDLYNRGGFSKGYYFEHNGRKLMSMERPNHSGVLVGKVSKLMKNRCVIELCEDLNPQDVLEIRGSKEEQIYEFTVKEAVGKCEHYEANFKAGSKVVKGQNVYRTKNQSLLDCIQNEVVLADHRIPVDGCFMGKKGEPVTLVLSKGDVQVTVMGDQAEAALNQPVSEEKIRKQLNKTKETLFHFENLKIVSSNDWFIPLGKINELRRNAFEQLENALAAQYYRKMPEKKEVLSGVHENREADEPELFVTVMTEEQFEAVYQSEAVKRIGVYFSLADEFEDFSVVEAAKNEGKEVYLVMPAVFRRDAWDRYEKAKKRSADLLRGSLLDGVVVKNLEEVAFLRENKMLGDKKMILDYNMYVMNDEAKKFWEEEGVTGFTASMELNSQELKQLDIENFDMIVYGYTPVMTSAQCVVKNTVGCHHKSGYYSFTDKNRNTFYGKNFCSLCYNVIYNGKPLHLLEHMDEIMERNVKNIRLDFTMESKAETKKIVNLYAQKLRGEESFTDLLKEYTKGHFRRGIE